MKLKMASKYEDNDNPQIRKEVKEGVLVQIEDTPLVHATTKKVFNRNNDYLQEDDTYTIASPSYHEMIQQMQEEQSHLDQCRLELDAIGKQIAKEESDLELT